MGDVQTNEVLSVRVSYLERAVESLSQLPTEVAAMRATMKVWGAAAMLVIGFIQPVMVALLIKHFSE